MVKMANDILIPVYRSSPCLNNDDVSHETVGRKEHSRSQLSPGSFGSGVTKQHEKST